MTGIRELNKRRTRERILEAARRLFSTHGCDKTTLRHVAEEAGVAVGSVFTTFDSKEDVLFEIAAERYDALAAAIDLILAQPKSARARLKDGFRTAYEFEYKRLALLIVLLGASWTWSKEFEARSQARLARPFGFLAKLVAEGCSNGELRRDTDQALLTDMLLGAYLRNFRHAWFRSLTASQIAALSERQIDLLFDGASA
jgi:AcrR family transcriptional regulator